MTTTSGVGRQASRGVRRSLAPSFFRSSIDSHTPQTTLQQPGSAAASPSPSPAPAPGPNYPGPENHGSYAHPHPYHQAPPAFHNPQQQQVRGLLGSTV